jgi:hypothetical protein
LIKRSLIAVVAGRNVLEIYVGENRLVRRIFTQ